MAFGYLSSKTGAVLLKTKINLPTVLTLAVLPDADLLLEKIPYIQHRGATHSIITALVLFAPFFIKYRKQAIPYFIAFVQHGLVGDIIGGGGVQLFWPFSTMGFGTGIDIRSLTNQTIESTMLLAAIILMIKMKDYKQFFKPNLSNLILTVPTITVLLPSLLSTPMEVPLLLIPPHLFLLILFATAILIETAHLLTVTFHKPAALLNTFNKAGKKPG